MVKLNFFTFESHSVSQCFMVMMEQLASNTTLLVQAPIKHSHICLGLACKDKIME